MEKFTVSVTAKHIKNGVDGDASSCAVALALRSLRLRNVQVAVYPSGDATFTSKGKNYTAKVPKRVLNFIEKFDNATDRSKLKPFSFNLKPVAV